MGELVATTVPGPALGQGNGLETDFGAHREALKDWDDP
jgi:hypothetical protein